jgi:truncated hemoglobin YjbI
MRRNTPKKGPMAPDASMWLALEEGILLRKIVDLFYQKVYADEHLSGFFKGVTVDRAAGKQYAFMRSILTGERVYFGDRPRNAHHWMVISDDLFDYRESLLEESMRAFDLDEQYIRKWRAIDEVYRKAIVKNEPRPRRAHGIQFPLEGYRNTVLQVDTQCDRCQTGLNCGQNVRYHVAHGEVYCDSCCETVCTDP